MVFSREHFNIALIVTVFVTYTNGARTNSVMKAGQEVASNVIVNSNKLNPSTTASTTNPQFSSETTVNHPQFASESNVNHPQYASEANFNYPQFASEDSVNLPSQSWTGINSQTFPGTVSFVEDSDEDDNTAPFGFNTGSAWISGPTSHTSVLYGSPQTIPGYNRPSEDMMEQLVQQMLMRRILFDGILRRAGFASMASPTTGNMASVLTSLHNFDK